MTYLYLVPYCNNPLRSSRVMTKVRRIPRSWVFDAAYNLMKVFLTTEWFIGLNNICQAWYPTNRIIDRFDDYPKLISCRMRNNWIGGACGGAWIQGQALATVQYQWSCPDIRLTDSWLSRWQDFGNCCSDHQSDCSICFFYVDLHVDVLFLYLLGSLKYPRSLIVVLFYLILYCSMRRDQYL